LFWRRNFDEDLLEDGFRVPSMNDCSDLLIVSGPDSPFESANAPSGKTTRILRRTEVETFMVGFFGQLET
jgi:hypothetical protein